MEQMTARARAVMNLMLLATIILAWTGFHKRPNVLQLGLNIFQLAQNATKLQKPEKFDEFISQVRMYRLQGSDDAQAIGSVKVSTILSLADLDMKSLFPRTKTLSKKIESTVEAKMPQVFEALGLDLSATAVRQYSITYSPEAQRFQRYLDQLDRFFADSKATEKASMKELHDKVIPKIEIPFLKQKVPIEIATTLLSLGLLPVFLYFISICRAMKVESQLTQERKGTDWIFFHPGRLGVCLAILWLSGPSLMVLAGWISIGFPKNLSPAFVLLLASLAAFSVWAALSARRSFLPYIQQVSDG